MRIGILGTRGVPNRYGGFEEFAEKMAEHWSEEGHDVFIFCKEEQMNIKYTKTRVNRIFIKSIMTQFVGEIWYDYLSNREAIKLDLDIIFHAGYATSVIPNLFFTRKFKDKLVYNMDGLEWKRSKFNFITRKTIKCTEFLAVRSCKNLISDNIGIKDYLFTEYGVESTVIEYGANETKVILKFSDYPEIFDLVIARFEPENHIEEIVDAYLTTESDVPLILVANSNTILYKRINHKLKNTKKIIYLGPIYDKARLHFLRKNSRYYIHGHSVGGTNPSLIEALVDGCNILAHNNEFNSNVIQNHGKYWKDVNELKILIASEVNNDKAKQIHFAKNRFDWKKISQQYLNYFLHMASKRKFN